MRLADNSRHRVKFHSGPRAACEAMLSAFKVANQGQREGFIEAIEAIWGLEIRVEVIQADIDRLDRKEKKHLNKTQRNK